jgi:hypothetical protein
VDLLTFVTVNVDRRQPWRCRPPEEFVMHVIHDPEEIDRFVADIGRLNVNDTAGHPIDGFVREFIRQRTTTRCENHYQSPANFLVQLPGTFAIGIEPGQ